MVPPEIKRDTAISEGKIETETAAFEARDEDLNIVIGAKFFDDFATVLERCVAGEV